VALFLQAQGASGALLMHIVIPAACLAPGFSPLQLQSIGHTAIDRKIIAIPDMPDQESDTKHEERLPC
jgi:hypothetical protein